MNYNNIPNIQDLYDPIMNFMVHKEIATTAEIRDAMKAYFYMDDFDVEYKSDERFREPLFNDRVNSACSDLCAAGFLIRLNKGRYRIAAKRSLGIKGTGCKTPYFKEEDFRNGFVKTVNELISERDEMLKNAREMMEIACDTTKLETTQEKCAKEMTAISEKMEEVISHNSREPMEQAKYNEMYTELTKQYEAVKAVYESAEADIKSRKDRRELCREFIRTLADTGSVIEEFDDSLFRLLVEKIVVYTKEDVRYVYKNGVEIRADLS